VSYTWGPTRNGAYGYQLNLGATGNALNNAYRKLGAECPGGLGGDDTLSGSGDPSDTFKIGGRRQRHNADFFFTFPNVLPDYGNVVVLDSFSLGSFGVQAAMSWSA
jgi:hypothetical protein